MPDLTGVPIVAAQAASREGGTEGAAAHVCGRAGAACRWRQRTAQAPVAPGSVIAQQPPAGARVDQNTPVKLTVAK